MPMTLTKWWLALTDELARLAPKVTNVQSEPWTAALIMATEGAKIEGNLFSAVGYKRTIDAAAVKLGAPYEDGETKSTQYLPDVNGPEPLLFSIVYYQHLLRYKYIDTGNPFVLPSVIKAWPLVERNANQLKLRIDAYCRDPEHANLVKAVFPEVVNQQGSTLVEQLEHWLEEQTVEEKLVAQFEADTATVIKEHNVVTGSLTSLFTKLDNRLKPKEEGLREIVAYKKLIESLNDGSLSPEELDLDNASHLQKKFPDFADRWLDLNKIISEPSLASKWAVNVTRRGIGLLTVSAQVATSALRWSMGWITPKYISDRASNMADVVGGLYEGITPDSNIQRKKESVINAAEQVISSLASGLNSSQNTITSNDFKKMSSTDVTVLADKVATIRHMVNIQKCLEEYRAEHTTGLVKLSLTGVFKTITVLLSKSFLRPLIYEKVLLTLEAKKLEDQLAGLIARTQDTDAFDKSSVNSELRSALATTKDHSQHIVKNSRYLLFKEESKVASKQLNDVVDTVTPIRGK